MVASPLPREAVGLRERKRLRTADAIYDAAIGLLSERAYDEVTVDDICDRAEVARATFFRFYKTKLGLLEEFNRRLTAEAVAALEAASDATAAARLKVVQEVVARAWARSGPGMQGLALEVARAGLPTSERPLYPDLARVVGAIVAEGLESGEFADRGGLRPNFMGWLIVSTLAACVAGSIGGRGRNSIASSTAAGLELILSGLKD